LLGGYFGYVIDSELRLYSKVPLKRIPATEEYRATVLLCTDYGIVVVYENGVMLIAEDLSVKWHVAKFINDFFVQLDGDQLLFSNEDSGMWRLSVATGIHPDS